jgi:hypothetical protein
LNTTWAGEKLMSKHIKHYCIDIQFIREFHPNNDNITNPMDTLHAQLLFKKLNITIDIIYILDNSPKWHIVNPIHRYPLMF